MRLGGDSANLRGLEPGVADDAFGGVVSRLVGDHDVQTRSTSSSRHRTSGSNPPTMAHSRHGGGRRLLHSACMYRNNSAEGSVIPMNVLTSGFWPFTLESVKEFSKELLLVIGVEALG